MQVKKKLVTLCGLSKEETELDFSGQYLSAGDAVLIANDISDMGALSKLIFGRDFDEETQETPEPAALEMGMAEADFSNKNLGVGGAIIISAWLIHKD